MPLSDDEFESKVNELVGDLAMAVFQLIHRNVEPPPGFRSKWVALSQRFFDLER